MTKIDLRSPHAVVLSFFYFGSSNPARIPPCFRYLCSHKLLKRMKMLTRTPIPSLGRSKSDGLLGRTGWQWPQTWKNHPTAYRIPLLHKHEIKEH